jgi:inner membrane protein
MSPVTHFFTGWVIASTVPSLNIRDRGLITLAAVIPDVDGLGIIPEFLTRNSEHPLPWFSLYHHQLHNLAFCVLVTLFFVALANQKWITGVLVFFSFHVHLLEDLLGARGPDGYPWPIPYLRPFSNSLQLTWQGQWALNAWPNFVITLILIAITFYLAWATGRSPLEFISARANRAFVDTLRARFPGPGL